MIREYRIMNDLKPVYPSVPDTLHYSDDESIMGSEFYVMRKVDGVLIGNQIPAEWNFTPADTRRFCTGFWEKLIDLHQVDYLSAGLGDFGKPEGYVERQVLGWNRRYERAITSDADHFAVVRDWLVTSMPDDKIRHSILHGDYRIDNVILDTENPCNILAVLDWEICAVGNPLMDLGNSLAYWIQDDDPPGLKSMMVQPSNAPGMLTRSEILKAYRDRTGIDTSNFTFYQVYGYWRLAVILQQIYFRYFNGQTQDARFKSFGKSAQQLGEHCRSLISS
jgi:aminoglycoside phosphotransferase (APT) family kinase protein